MQEICARQMKFIGEERQKKLGSAKVTVVGCGSLGSFVISALVRSDVGFIRIIDRDYVEKSNLYANGTFDLSHIGKPKAIIMKDAMKKINEDCNTEVFVENLDYENTHLLDGTDIVIDCTDNMAARYLINDYCIKNKIPWIYGSVLGDEGYIMPVERSGKPCFRCVFGNEKHPENTCDTAGVLSPIVFIIASLQVYEAIKFFTDIGTSLCGQIIHVKLGKKDSELINVKPNLNCKACGTGEFPSLKRSGYRLISICGKDSYQLKPHKTCKIEPETFSKKLVSLGLEAENLKDVMIKIEHEGMKSSLFRNGTAIIKYGTKENAKKLYEIILKALD
ncbi:MAG: HesA/MoeB/ThiF family protein [Candidatus Aenigmarchaeota archaeon]|nr:HesA/MoeB/ThiF family protein [Candidatus Aenigmarchaeota archaeon]